MEKKTLTGQVNRKAKNGKGFLIVGQEGWFNAVDKVIPFLAKAGEGDIVTIDYDQEGIKKSVTRLVSGAAGEEKASASGFKCKSCGAALKDDKYENCYPCNQKSAGTKTPSGKSSWKSKTSNNYSNEDKTAQIQRGNALNAAAAAILSAKLFKEPPEDPEVLVEMTQFVAGEFLKWLRAE